MPHNARVILAAWTLAAVSSGCTCEEDTPEAQEAWVEPPDDRCGDLTTQLDGLLEAAPRRCESDEECAAFVRPLAPARMGDPPRPSACIPDAIAGNAADVRRLADQIWADDCALPRTGRCDHDDWIPFCDEGRCDAHSASGY